MALEEYGRKRRFSRTPEPPPKVEEKRRRELRFVVQKHQATNLHYDLRLEMEGVMKSWAVPKGPTQDPNEKRLAMMVEDHPLEYMHFEGIIPAGNYGAGTVMVWDTGTWEPARNPDPVEMLKKGDLKFILHGEKLKGEFALVRMRLRRAGSRGNEWLLLKKRDAYAEPGWDAADFDWSVLTHRSLEQIAADEASETWESNRKVAARGGERLKAGSEEEQLERAKHAAARRTIEMERRRKTAQPAGGRASAPSRTAGTRVAQKESASGGAQKEAPRRPAGVDIARLPGAKKAAMPRQVQPMLATLVREPEEGDDWLFEIKWDGVRAIAFIDNGRLRLQSRSLRDITAFYPDLAGIPGTIAAERAVLDGEIVTLDQEGRSSFERLQQRMNVVPDQRLLGEYPAVYYVFDLLYLDGYDLRGVALEKRKEALRAVMRAGADSHVRYSDHEVDHGKELADAAAERNLEGIVGKRRDSRYESRRSRAWLKIKTAQHAEAVIGGYTEPRGSRKYFGSLVLGEYRDGKLVHIGNAGSGFTQAGQQEVWEMLKPLRTDENPFAGKPRTPQRPHWVRPELHARVKFVEWTNDRKMRAPVVLDVFRAVQSAGHHQNPDRGQVVTMPARTTTPARSEQHEPKRANGSRTASRSNPRTDARKSLFSGDSPTQQVEAGGRVLKFERLNKLFFPDDGYTKRDVIDYYYRIADFLLPYMKDRPLTLKRYPDGIKGKFFFQKDAREIVPDWVPTVKIHTEHGHSEYIDQAVCNDVATLVYLANLGCIDQHVWLSRAGSLENPDFVLFDMDPGEQVTFDQLLEVVLSVKDKLDRLGIAGYPKTSGATGMHIWAPLVPKYTYDDTRNFAHLVYQMAAADVRNLITFERSLSRRPKNRVYCDYLQNAIAKSVPPPYSLRPRKGAPVSTPLEWREVKKGLDPQEFNIQTIWNRLEKLGDLYRGVLEKPQRIEPALERAQQLFVPAPRTRTA